MIDPRRRALAALAGGAYIPTDEVDVEQVPVESVPGVPEPLPSPDSEEVARGKPVVGEVHAAPDEYAQALQQSHERAFQESLAGVGSGIIKAFTGVGREGDDEARRNFINEPIAQYLQKQKEEERKRALDIQQVRAAKPTTAAAAKAMKDRDPKSAVSLRYRSALSARFPGAPKELLDNVTEENYDKIIGTLEEVEKDRRARDLAGLQSSDRAKALKQQAGQHSEDLDARYAAITASSENADKGLAAAKAYRDAQMGVHAQDTVDAQTKDLAGELDKLGSATFNEKYDEASKLLAKYPKDIPGFGRIEGSAPSEFISEDGRQLRMLIGQMLSDYRKGQSGTGMSDSERVEYGQITGLMHSGNDQDVVKGLGILKRAMDARQRGIEAGYKPEAVATYHKRLKPTPAPQRKPAATVLPTDSTGQPTLDAPADTVRIILNGKPKDVPRANLEKVKALAKQKGYTLEVPNG